MPMVKFTDEEIAWLKRTLYSIDLPPDINTIAGNTRGWATNMSKSVHARLMAIEPSKKQPDRISTIWDAIKTASR